MLIFSQSGINTVEFPIFLMPFSPASEVLWKETATFHHVVRPAPSSLEGRFSVISAHAACCLAVQQPAHLALAMPASCYRSFRARIAWCCLSSKQSWKIGLAKNFMEFKWNFEAGILLRTSMAGTANWSSVIPRHPVLQGWAHRKRSAPDTSRWRQVLWATVFTLAVVKNDINIDLPVGQMEADMFPMVHLFFCESGTRPSNFSCSSEGWRDASCGTSFSGGSIGPF